MTDKEDSAVNFFVGFLVGTFAGIAFWLLYAPRLGAETRKLLREKAGAAVEKILEAGDEN
jgi:gas vesicle protein